MDLITKKLKDKDILWLINQVIDSYSSNSAEKPSTGVQPLKGISLGNLTSQIFANIYLNELDRFAKHNLKIRYYLRYADDFLLLDKARNNLYRCIDTLKQFIHERLKLDLHPDKISLRRLSWGIDFCGYLVLLHYRLVKTQTKRRIIKKAKAEIISNQSLQSYLGHFSHAESYQVCQELKNLFYLKADRAIYILV